MDDFSFTIIEHNRHTGRKLVELLMKDKDINGSQFVKVLEFILSPPRFMKLTSYNAGKLVQLSKRVMPHMSDTVLKLLCEHGFVVRISDVKLAISMADKIAIPIIDALPPSIRTRIDFTQICTDALQSHQVNQDLIVYLLNHGAKPKANVLRLIDSLEMLDQSCAIYCLSTASHASLLQFLNKIMYLKPIQDCFSMYEPLGGMQILLEVVRNRNDHEKISMTPCEDETLTDIESDNEFEIEVDDEYDELDNCQSSHKLEEIWEVECASHVYKLLKNKHFPDVLRKMFFKRIHQLASGDRSEALQKPVIKCSGPPLYEAKLSKAARIIWEETKPQFSPRLSKVNKPIFTEVIRIWDIVIDHDKLYKKISKASKRRKEFKYTHIHYEMSNVKIHVKSITENANSGIVPKQPQIYCKVDDDDAHTVDHELFITPPDPIENNHTATKFYSCSSEFVASLLSKNDEQKDFPFKEWPDEYDVINMPVGQPILLLGRSGTGKSICCLYRMWNLFKNYWKKVNDVNLSAANESSLHQIFITKSKHLCDYTKECFYNMAASQEYLKEHIKHEKKKLPNVLSKVSDLSYPLFLTSREFFVLLDNSLDGAHFFPRAATEVTASYFETSIWPKLKNKSWKFNHFNPTLVWMEIISIIKGSYEAMQQPKGCLSKEQYISIGQKMAPTFSQDDKAHIYAIFVLYQKYLQTESAFDECDLLHNIYIRFLKCTARLENKPLLC